MTTHVTPAPDPMARFGPLSVAEQAVRQAAAAGGTTPPPPPRLGMGHPDLRVRAEVVSFLATGGDTANKPHERGFGLRGLKVVGVLQLSGCTVAHPLRFVECHLDGIDIVGATLSTFSVTGGRAGRIYADRCTAAALFVRSTWVGEGGLRLLGAEIAGDLDCSDSYFEAACPASLDAHDGIELTTALGLDGATIKGAFFVRGARLVGSVQGVSVAVGKVVDLRGTTITSGQLALSSSVLGGDLLLRGCVIRTSIPYPPSPYLEALALDQARIAGSVRLTDKFQADGPVNLNLARIGGSLSLRGALFLGSAPFAVVARSLVVDGALELDSSTGFGASAYARACVGDLPAPGSLEARRAALDEPPPYEAGAALDLTSATVQTLSDEWARWPVGNAIRGFRYASLGVGTFTRSGWWIRWLQCNAGTTAGAAPDAADFRPQEWDRAIAALREAGCERDAVDVSIAKQAAEYALDKSWLTPLRALWGVATGYGYRPLRLLWALPIVFGVSGAVYQQAADAGAMAPTKEELFAKPELQRCEPEHGGNWTRCALAPEYPDFNAWAYAAQMLLPAIELRQAKDWAPVPWTRAARPAVAPARAASGASAAAASRDAVAEALPQVSPWGRRALWCSWVEAVLGLAAPVLVGLAWSGLIQRKWKD